MEMGDRIRKEEKEGQLCDPITYKSMCLGIWVNAQKMH